MRIEWQDDKGELFTFINNLRVNWFRDANLYIVDLVDSRSLPNGQTKEFHDVREAFDFCANFEPPASVLVTENTDRSQLRELVKGRGFTVGNIDVLTDSEVREFLRAAKAWHSMTEKMNSRVAGRKVKVA